MPAEGIFQKLATIFNCCFKLHLYLSTCDNYLCILCLICLLYYVIIACNIIFSILPITHRLKSWLKNQMALQKLIRLALMSIHLNINIYVDTIINPFQNPRETFILFCTIFMYNYSTIKFKIINSFHYSFNRYSIICKIVSIKFMNYIQIFFNMLQIKTIS